MSNLIIIPKKNGYLVRNQNENREMAVFKTKQDAQTFIKNYKTGKLNVHSHEHNNHICNAHNNGSSNMMYSQQLPPVQPYNPNMIYPPQMPGQTYPNMMYPQQLLPVQPYNPNMMYPQMPGQMYPNMMYPQQLPPVQPYNPNMMLGYGVQNSMPHSGINQQCECGYIYNNEYEGEFYEENDLLDFETDSPELIKPPEISEMNKTLGEQKSESEKPKVDIPIEDVQTEQNTVAVEQKPIVVSEINDEQKISPVVNASPIIVKEPTIMMSDLTNFSIEDDEPVKVNKHSTQEQIDTTKLSKKELKDLKKQQKKELKLIRKQEKRNKHIYDEMEDYDF